MEVYFIDNPLVGSHVRSYKAEIVGVREGDNSVVVDLDAKLFILYKKV